MADANLNLFNKTPEGTVTGRLGGVLPQFGIVVLCCAVLTFGLSALLVGAAWGAIALAMVGYGIGSALAMGLLRRGYPHGLVGLCNVVTQVRLAIAASLLAPLILGGAASWVVFVVAAIGLSLDGADGWLARREGFASAFGARFDMEVDSALALILALNAWVTGTAGVLVLLIGVPRYVFAAAAVVWPWINGPLPERFSRKVVCVLQLATLIALQLPFVASSLANPIVAVVGVALAWSFGRDLLWLWRARR